MNKKMVQILGLLCFSPAAWASVQDVTGVSCAGEMRLVNGHAFNLQCAGDLHLDAASVIEADESITLLAAGNLWMAGRLLAPRIELVAEASTQVTGSLFFQSQGAVFYADVNALPRAGSGTISIASYPDLDSRYLTATRVVGLPIDRLVPITGGTILLVAEAVPSPVPEPAPLALFAAGLGLLAWKRRSVAHVSQTAQANRNPNATQTPHLKINVNTQDTRAALRPECRA